MAVKVKGWKGVAFNVLGPEMVEQDPENAWWTGGELAPHECNVRVVMVGDNKVHIVDKDDCTEIPEEDYCHECGQIGCTHDGLDRG
jgi:hypothetical protein